MQPALLLVCTDNFSLKLKKKQSDLTKFYPYRDECINIYDNIKFLPEFLENFQNNP